MLGGDESWRTSDPTDGSARLATLAAFARDAASAPRAREVAAATLRHVCALEGVRGGAFLVRSAHGELEPLAQAGAFEGPLEVRRTMRGSGDDASARPSWLEEERLFVVPLPGADVLLALACEEPPPAAQRELLESVAGIAASAFLRASRYESERSERVAAARLGVMLEAGQAIARATDAEEVLTRLSELLVPRFADLATIDVVEPDGRSRLSAVAHVDRASVLCPPRSEAGASRAPEPVLAAIRTGEPILLDQIDELVARMDPVVTTDARDPSVVRSAMVVPLAARQQVLGAMTLVSWRDGLMYDEMDLRLAGKIAQHAALALHNARLIESERSSRREAQSANRMKDAFLATVSHELRTPLHAILGWATLLRSGRLDEAGKLRAVETIERNARTQARLVDDVLDVSRIVSGKISLDLGLVEAQSALKQAVEVVWPTAQEKHVTLEATVPADLGRVRADRDRLVQVFWNVLSNAVKFTPSSGRVTLGARRERGRVVVRITDTGKGIRPEFIPHLFEPFRQEDASTTRQYGGLGLGLSIARQLMRLHGGTITAESEGEGHGATFVIELPSLER